jgi:hypothetical protein
MEYVVILVVATTTGFLALGMVCSGLAAVIYVTERVAVRVGSTGGNGPVRP